MTQYPVAIEIDESLASRVRLRMNGRNFRETAREIGIRPTTLCSAYHGKKPGIVEESKNLYAWLWLNET